MMVEFHVIEQKTGDPSPKSLYRYVKRHSITGARGQILAT